MPRDAHQLTISEAIDRAGPVLFGTDWVDRLTAKEAQALRKYGPKPRGAQYQSIEACPRAHRIALDRAIGRDARLAVQRATVLDWLYASRVMNGRNHCDRTELNKKLAKSKTVDNPVGAPAVVRQRVFRQMVDDLQSGKLSPKELEDLKQEVLQKDYGASRKVCKPARIDALTEARRRGLP